MKSLSQIQARRPFDEVPDVLKRASFWHMNPKTRNLERITLELNNSLQLRCRADQQTIIDIYNAFLEMLPGKIPGIRLSNGVQTFEFFGKVSCWFESLKRYCVQRNFPYQFGNLLSNGSCSKVYKIDLEKPCAAKVYRKEHFATPQDLACLCNEIDILRLMQHQGINRLLEVFESQEEVILVFEYIGGGDLQSFMRRRGKALSEQLAKKIIYRIAEILKYIHSKGVMHRDIKLSNILMRSANDVLVTDFGMADFFRKDGKYLYQRCGTAGFVAPEILRNEAYSYSVDVFSLGVLAYTILCGRQPFKSKYYDETLRLNEMGLADFALDLSPECIDVLRGMLQPDPGARFQIDRVLSHGWFRKDAQTPGVAQRNLYFAVGASPRTQAGSSKSPSSEKSTKLRFSKFEQKQHYFVLGQKKQKERSADLKKCLTLTVLKKSKHQIKMQTTHQFFKYKE